MPQISTKQVDITRSTTPIRKKFVFDYLRLGSIAPTYAGPSSVNHGGWLVNFRACAEILLHLIYTKLLLCGYVKEPLSFLAAATPFIPVPPFLIYRNNHGRLTANSQAKNENRRASPRSLY
ncbi:MAG: hypothetical protein P4L99_22170 [Chthoniobacter sp.]|nr:hypothetical protein [Chthoniobacter sp.]